MGQQQACTPDVWRLCGAQIPDVDGSWLAYGAILRNSAIGAARFLNKATMRPHVVRIATTGKGVTIEIMGHVTRGTTVQGVTTGTTAKVLWL